MRKYLTKAAVVISLHERGFTEDFVVVGDRVLWVQRKVFLKQGDLKLVEAHSFIAGDGSEQLIMGAHFVSHFAHGILLWDFELAAQWQPKMIEIKMKELMARLLPSTDVYWSEFGSLHFQ